MTDHPDKFNPYLVVTEFENRIAEWAGSKYAVAVESGTAAIFLSLQYIKQHRGLSYVSIPRFTYPSVPCSIIHAGAKVLWTNEPWSGVYELKPYGIIDGALRFKKGMYKGGLHCLSFHIKKHLPIGRGGMILTDDVDVYNWLKKARFDGRDPVPLGEDNFTMLGYNMYMTPADAVRGIQLFETVRDKDLPDLDVAAQGYPNLSRFKIYET